MLLLFNDFFFVISVNCKLKQKKTKNMQYYKYQNSMLMDNALQNVVFVLLKINGITNRT